MSGMDKQCEYVVGFVFNESRTCVALIRKNRPKWQAGKLNGIGGHIKEEDKSPIAAMVREFYEETDFMIDEEDWEEVCVMYRDGDNPFKCHVFRCFSSIHSLHKSLKSITDEKIEVCDTRHIGEGLSNVQWLVGMCLDDNPGDFENYQVAAVIGRNGIIRAMAGKGSQ